MIWYHGGSRINDWNDLRWDRDRSTSDGNAEGPGMYWTSDQEEASGYTHGAEDPVLYQAEMRDSFRKFPNRKPSTKALMDLYELADPEPQGYFLSNWQVDRDSATKSEIAKALKPYTGQNNLFDAYVTLYHDLFAYNAEGFVSAMRTLGYDGHVYDRGGGGGSNKRKHLVLWQPKAMRIEEV